MELEKKPLKEPLFTTLLAQDYARKSQTPKPTAQGTMLRYSGAYGCGRQMGYTWFEAEYSEPPTPGSLFQALLGTIIGEHQANAMIAKYGGVAELPSQVNEHISGSADWFSTTTPLGVVVYEHKMKSSYAFNKAMGYKRAFGKASLVEPGGPPMDAVTQAGMNALGIERTYDRRTLTANSEAEQKAARKLGVSVSAITSISFGLWSDSFTSERDNRVKKLGKTGVSSRTLQALRGHVSRTMIEEIKSVVARGDDGELLLSSYPVVPVYVDAVVVGIVSADVITVSQNKQIQVDDLARFSGEWAIPREVWEPAALREIGRLGEIAEMLDLGYMPDRIALDDTGERLFLNPGGNNWQCDYCPYVSLCQSDGEGQVRVLDSKLTRRVKSTEEEMK